MAQAVDVGLSRRKPGFEPSLYCVGLLVDKVALRQVFVFEYIGFPLSLSFNHRSTFTNLHITDAL